MKLNLEEFKERAEAIQDEIKAIQQREAELDKERSKLSGLRNSVSK